MSDGESSSGPGSMENVGIDDILARHRGRIEAALDRAMERLEEELPAVMAGAVRHGVTGGGKRLRPVLCAAAFESVGACENAPDALYDLAAALEMIHAYSLMHDDLPCMDDAELRRGRPTTHRVHGERVTMRAGAALIPAAALQALRAGARLELDATTAAEATRVLLEASGGMGMVGGQWLDLDGEGRALTPGELDDLHRRKTGALLVASLEMGAVAGGASPGERQALVAYGAAVGLAFQVADDILDHTSDAATLGKNPSDAALDKSTYVGLHGLEGARNRAASLVEDAVSALRGAGLRAPELEAVAAYVVERPK